MEGFLKRGKADALGRGSEVACKMKSAFNQAVISGETMPSPLRPRPWVKIQAAR